MSKKYSISVFKHLNDDEAEVIFDKHVTADQAIDVLVFAQQLVDAETGGDGVETVVAQVTAVGAAKSQATFSTPEAPKPEPKKATSPRASYEREALLADIESGVLGTKEIAEKHGVAISTIYTLRYELKKKGNPGKTAYMERREELEQAQDEETDPLAEVRRMAREGCSISELQMMFPRIELIKIQEVYNEVKGE